MDAIEHSKRLLKSSAVVKSLGPSQASGGQIPFPAQGGAGVITTHFNAATGQAEDGFDAKFSNSGCLLCAGAFLSVGMLFSALSKNQVVAFILGVTASVAFLLLGLPETLDLAGRALGGWVEQVLSSLSLVDHFETLTRGLVEVGTLFFFAAFTVGWLLCGMLALDETKAR